MVSWQIRGAWLVEPLVKGWNDRGSWSQAVLRLSDYCRAGMQRDLSRKESCKAIGEVLYVGVPTRLFDHLNNNAVLNEHQYGFRSEVSTENASHILLNEILTPTNSKRMVEEYFVTFTKHLTVLIMLCY